MQHFQVKQLTTFKNLRLILLKTAVNWNKPIQNFSLIFFSRTNQKPKKLHAISTV